MQRLPTRRNGKLTEKQQAQLKALEKRKTLTAYQRGQLEAFRIFGDRDESRRAAAVLSRAKENRK